MLPKSPHYLPLLFANDSQDEAAHKAGIITDFLLNPTTYTHQASSSLVVPNLASSNSKDDSNRFSICSQGTPALKELFSESASLVENALYGKPFERFLDDSSFFKRYLQIKHLEKLPINKNTFRMYRGSLLTRFL